RKELKKLRPDVMYEFRFVKNLDSPGKLQVYRFRTMPETLNRPIRFVAGGDMLHRADWMRNTAQQVMQTGGENLDFALIGGDLAYADGEARKVSRWYDYFKVWSETMITSYDRVIPHIAAIGNHEVKNQFVYNYHPAEYTHPDFALREAPFYSTFIPFPGEQGYGVLDFGEYLSLYILDSGHIRHIEGAQTDWLRVTMHERRDRIHHIPVYHVAAFPSARDYTYRYSTKIRNKWVPVFEEYGVRLAFEHHDHTYKRTHPVREEKVDASGIFYVGDGAWGVRTRTPATDSLGYPPWYIANSDSVRHYIMGTIDGEHIHLDMFDESGSRFDGLHIVPGHYFD
ncbi:metallophosphoesterase, partial [Balneolaceae bacterium ANBcel3]|nr:metallophosphoesterase [Balneolaceae bacterium ANBcel3]